MNVTILEYDKVHILLLNVKELVILISSVFVYRCNHILYRFNRGFNSAVFIVFD